jgi:hypothetical protein
MCVYALCVVIVVMAAVLAREGWRECRKQGGNNEGE